MSPNLDFFSKYVEPIKTYCASKCEEYHSWLEPQYNKIAGKSKELYTKWEFEWYTFVKKHEEHIPKWVPKQVIDYMPKVGVGAGVVGTGLIVYKIYNAGRNYLSPSPSNGGTDSSLPGSEAAEGGEGGTGSGALSSPSPSSDVGLPPQNGTSAVTGVHPERSPSIFATTPSIILSSLTESPCLPPGNSGSPQKSNTSTARSTSSITSPYTPQQLGLPLGEGFAPSQTPEPLTKVRGYDSDFSTISSTDLIHDPQLRSERFCASKILKRLKQENNSLIQRKEADSTQSSESLTLSSNKNSKKQDQADNYEDEDDSAGGSFDDLFDPISNAISGMKSQVSSSINYCASLFLRNKYSGTNSSSTNSPSEGGHPSQHVQELDSHETISHDSAPSPSGSVHLTGNSSPDPQDHS